MKPFIKSILSTTMVLASFMSFAEDDQHQALIDKFESIMGWDVESVADAPVKGLLQLTTARGIFYASEDGGYLLQARIFNTNNGMANETELALSSIRLDGVKQFHDDMIEFKAKDEKYVVSVFTDITCGYCRKLHNEIQDYNDAGITVRYMAFPRAGVQSPTYTNMVSVWCAENPQKALTDAKSDSEIAASSCANSIEEQYLFGQKVGVGGTPSIVLPDSSLVPGYQPAPQLLLSLENAS